MKLEISAHDSVTITEALQNEWERLTSEANACKREGLDRSCTYYRESASRAYSALINMYRAMHYSDKEISNITDRMVKRFM